MKRRIFALAMVLVMALGLLIPAAAFEDHNYLYVAISDMDNQRLTEQGETTLPAMSDQVQCSLRVDIVDTTEDETLEDYAQIFYDKYGYGDDHDGSGALLMIQVADLGGTVDIVDYTLYGGGRGADAIGSQGADLMVQTLDVTLVGSGLSYAEAGEVCANAVDTYMGVMASILMAMPAATQTEPVPAEPSALVEPEAPAEPTPGPVESQAPAEPETPAEPEVEPVDIIAAPTGSDSAPAETQNYIIDEAGLLTQAQWLKLENRAQKTAEKYGCGVYVLTVDTMNGVERRDFAKDYYASHKLGVGDYQNGILFLVCMDTREYVTITYGRNPNKLTEYGVGILAFTDEGIEAMEDEVVSKLSDGDYNGAFDTYLSTCEDYLSYYAENGEGMVPGSGAAVLIRVAIVIFVPLLIALIVCLIFVSQMKTARAAATAGEYVDGFHLTRERDQYTHTTTTRRKIERESSSGSSSVDSDGFGGSSGGHF